ncbi:hypothetical protein BROUX41_002726 [Berkeleyomyces rouxiae]|uniref:uncharacterized protein n=1 Tax=Berkeleyomyces rouxiae TaxID=2035830 RepID=UPI003B7E48D3
MASEAAQSRYSAGPSTAPSFAASTRATSARSRATPRRVVTNPAPRLASSIPSEYDASSPANAPLAESKANKKVETLYSHPNVKIIAFSATARTSPRSAAAQHSPKEVLTWSSHLERTIAVGAFKIYRAPGSVAFLNCGSALQPILPKSQCWCLDEEGSRFVLQIRRPQYWRIELPLDSSDDCHRAELLRDVLNGILLFEKTVCPFERTFGVEIPEPSEPSASTLPKRQLWKPSDTAFVSPLGPYDKSPSSNDVPAHYRSGHASSTHSNLYTKSPGSTPERPTTSHSESSLSEVSEADTEYCLDESYLPTPKVNPAHVEVKPMVTNLEAKISAESRRQEWIRKQYVHSLQDEKNKGPAYLDDFDEFDDDVSDIGSVVSDLTYVRTMTSRSLYSRQRETAVFEAEDATARPGRNISRDIHRTGNEIHEGSGMGGNSVVKRRLRRPGFQALRTGNMPPHMSMPYSSGSKGSGEGPNSRPQSPLSMAPRTLPPLTMAPRPPHTRPARVASSISTHSSRSASSTSSSQGTVTARDPSPIKTREPIRRSSTENEAPRQAKSSTTHSTPDPLNETSNSPEPTKAIPQDQLDTTRDTKREEVETKILDPSTKTKALSLDTSVATLERDTTLEDSIKVSKDAVEPNVDASPVVTTPATPMKPIISPFSLRQRPSHRTTTSISQRAVLSPLPSITDLFSSPRASGYGYAHRYSLSQVGNMHGIPWSIVAKTCDLILGPPRNLLRLMLHVAAKIVAGQWRGTVYGHGLDGSQIPVHWDYSDEADVTADATGENPDGIDENGDDYYARGRKLASDWRVSDDEDLD